MSENYRFYMKKVVERRVILADLRLVCAQLTELLETVSRCEAMWALETRIERSR